MRKKGAKLTDLLEPKHDSERLERATFYLAQSQVDKIARFAAQTNRGKSEFLRDILNTVFWELEEEEEHRKKADENSPT